MEEEKENLKVRVERYIDLVRTVPMFAPSMEQPGSAAMEATRELVEYEVACSRYHRI